jgi:hypothetical protein
MSIFSNWKTKESKILKCRSVKKIRSQTNLPSNKIFSQRHNLQNRPISIENQINQRRKVKPSSNIRKLNKLVNLNYFKNKSINSKILSNLSIDPFEDSNKRRSKDKEKSDFCRNNVLNSKISENSAKQRKSFMNGSHKIQRIISYPLNDKVSRHQKYIANKEQKKIIQNNKILTNLISTSDNSLENNNNSIRNNMLNSNHLYQRRSDLRVNENCNKSIREDLSKLKNKILNSKVQLFSYKGNSKSSKNLQNVLQSNQINPYLVKRSKSNSNINYLGTVDNKMSLPDSSTSIRVSRSKIKNYFNSFKLQNQVKQTNYNF